MMTLPSPVSEALTRLHRAGFEAYVVGGCVRDALMGKVPNDYDIGTSATPLETEAVFSDCRRVETGIKHGTITVLLAEYPLEITTFRTEYGYSDGRHPDSVKFTRTLQDDLSRRDFTMNAMAFSPAIGLIDPFGGQADIATQTIRCVGNPVVRFSEDALRIMRALRFASVLNFSIAPDTAEAMQSLAERLSMISSERIAAELKKAIVGDSFHDILIAFPLVFGTFLPELIPCIDYNQNNPHHDYDLLTHLAKTVHNLPKDPTLKLAGLLHDIGKPSTQTTDASGISHFYGHAAKSESMAEEALKRLKFSNAEITRITTLIRHHDGVIEANERSVKRKISKLGKEAFQDLLFLQRADHEAQRADRNFRKEQDDLLFQLSNDVMSNSECLQQNQLHINGYDMINIGLSGPEIGKTLATLLDAVLDGEVENEYSALLSYANALINRKYP